MSARLFVALDLPGAAREALAAFRDVAADPDVWRPLDAASFHVTLAFLGHRPEDDVARLRAALDALPATTAPPLRLGRALVLGRVLAVALDDAEGALAALHAAVLGALAGLHEPEARPLRPHVTVARARPRTRPPRRVAAAPEPLAFAGGAVTLYRSRLGPGGARYEPLWTTFRPG